MSRAQLDGLYAALAGAPVAQTIAELRDGFTLFGTILNADPPAVASVERVAIAGGVAVDVVVPPGTAPFPVLVYFHGGGWSIGSPATHAKLVRQLAVGAGAIVVAVDYRLAPEHPFPAPLDDCVAAVRWTRATIARHGGDPTRLALGGDSAGGNLTAAVAGVLAAEVPLRAALLLYGAFDLGTILAEHAARRPDGSDPILPYASTKLMCDAYLSGGADPGDSRVSPLHGDLRHFPSACCIVGDADPIVDQTLHMHAALRAAGRDATLHRFPDMPHAFLQLPGLDESLTAIDVASAFLRARLAP